MENAYTLNNTTVTPNLEKTLKTGLLTLINEDIRCALQRDPAARSGMEVFLNYSGLHAIWVYRVSHWLWQKKTYFLARWLSQFARWITGVEIHPGASIGRRLFIDHGMGVVIGETAEVGSDVTLYHGVTLGGVSLEKGKRHPTLEDRVVVGAGAKILGAIKIGESSRIGANAVVVKDVPPNSVVVGIPGQVVKRAHQYMEDNLDLHHDHLPDTLGMAMQEVLTRLDYLEGKLHVHDAPHIHTDAQGNWEGTDFSI